MSLKSEEQGKTTTPPAGTPSDQGTGQGEGQPSNDGQPTLIKVGEREYTPEQIEAMEQKAASYDELRPKYTKLTQKLAERESDEDDDEDYGRSNQPTYVPQGTDPRLAAEVTYLKKNVSKVMESIEEQALEKKLTAMKGKYSEMDEVEVLAALSVDPEVDIEEASKFSHQKNEKKLAEMRARIEKEAKEKSEGKLEGGDSSGGSNIPPAGEQPKTFQEAGKRFLERLRASKQAAQS